MVFLTPKPRRVLAACCRVDVIKGADGLDFVGLSSRFNTLNSELRKIDRAASASTLLVGRKDFPLSRLTSKRILVSSL